MESKKFLYVMITVLVIILLGFFILNSSLNSNIKGKTLLAIQLTDPPNVPQGSQHLLVTYSSIKVHELGENQSGWIDAQGNGTVDLLELQNDTKTIATAQVDTNSMINIIKLNITSVKIVINNVTYNATVSNNQLNIVVVGETKINSSTSAAVVLQLSPTVNSKVGENSNAYLMTPVAKAIVVNTNASVNVNIDIGDITSISSVIKTKLDDNIENSTQTDIVVLHQGERIRNFFIQNINYSNNTVTGLLYILYPVATDVSIQTTLHINDKVGYACDNTQAKLTSVNSNNTSTFTEIFNSDTHNICPV